MLVTVRVRGTVHYAEWSIKNINIDYLVMNGANRVFLRITSTHSQIVAPVVPFGSKMGAKLFWA